MDIKKLDSQLKELESQYKKWINPIEEINAKYRDKFDSEEDIPEEYYIDLKKAEDEQKRFKNPHIEIYNYFDQLCLVYYDSKPKENEEIRNIVLKNKGILNCLLGYALRSSTLLDQYPDIELLRMGLVALSIENCSTNYLKTKTMLKDLFLKGERNNLDSKNEFIKLSFISSNKITNSTDKSFKLLLKEAIIEKDINPQN